ncbi:bile acid:sodium symporter family protein [Saccharicrinis sp. FJH2]|uniref:bile acid:sodium symporter family protein n=1 Tax=Saccharicrinis sp. FJH65 TaxID=3344659 RepID=UPI0035F362D7
MEESLRQLDSVVLNFNAKSVDIMNIALALIMFGVALGIKFRDFKELFHTPKQVITGVIAQFIALPAFTFVLVVILKPTPTVALGMILVAACPGGNISNFISALGKGNTALSVTLTAIATLAAIFMTPLNFSFWGSMYIDYYSKIAAEGLLRPIEIDIFQIFKTVFILLGIPLILGLLFAHYLPKVTQKIKSPLRIISIIIFLGFVAGALFANFDHFQNYIHLIFLIVLIHNGLALLTGFSIATIAKVNRPSRRAITIETGIQNSGLALALIFNPKIFPPELQLGGMAMIAAWWGIWHIISGLTIAFFLSRKDIRNEPSQWTPSFLYVFKSKRK